MDWAVCGEVDQQLLPVPVLQYTNLTELRMEIPQSNYQTRFLILLVHFSGRLHAGTLLLVQT